MTDNYIDWFDPKAETARFAPGNEFDVAESMSIFLSRQLRLSEIESALKWDDDPERRQSFTREYHHIYEELNK